MDAMDIFYKQVKENNVYLALIAISLVIQTFFNSIKRICKVQMLSNFLLIQSVFTHVANHAAGSFRNSLNKQKCLHKKKVQLPQDWFETPTWPPFTILGQ